MASRNTTPRVTIIILLGSSGSGKGTQAELITGELGLGYIGTGNILRARQKLPDFTGKKIKKVLEAGLFVPSPIIFKEWMDRWEGFKSNPEFKGFLIDGSPRKLLEAKLMDQALEWYEWEKYLHVLLIDISREEALARLLNRRICKDCGSPVPFMGKLKNMTACDACGGDLIKRADDTKKAINSRLDEFERETVPVIEYYQESKRLTKINGEQSVEDVHSDIIKAMGK